MDIKELKKLINEEVQRVKQKNLIKESGLTGVGTPGAIQRRASGQLTAAQQRIQSEENALFQVVKRDADILLNDAEFKNWTLKHPMGEQTKKFVENLKNAQNVSEIYSIVSTHKNYSLPTSSEKAMNLLSAVTDIERKHSGQLSPSIGSSELERGIATLRKGPTQERTPIIGGQSGEEGTTTVSPFADTRRSNIPVNPVKSDERTSTIKKNRNV